ncbi:MAG: tRNA pseudouridine(38-40) synthase TruA [Desulfobacterales bacterium]|nr:tRNA pseudouridine(38-40) synthase TruA [Desulfobacterales bacterium]
MNYYLIHIQYLGFRFHGWQRQPGVKTVESMVVKTLEFVLGHPEFKILGTSRTDAMVSADHSAFELFIEEDIEPASFLKEMNTNLPPDIRALEIEAVGPGFNIINSPRTKTYLYLFSHGEKAHPFCAPLMACFREVLDIPAMQAGADLFKGAHNFVRYCTRAGADTCFEREILVSRIKENTEYSASFFPEQTWAYEVASRGFMRHQVRLMMGQLIALGKGMICLEDIRESLSGKTSRPLRTIAPASGLMLKRVDFHNAGGMNHG